MNEDERSFKRVTPIKDYFEYENKKVEVKWHGPVRAVSTNFVNIKSNFLFQKSLHGLYTGAAMFLGVMLLGIVAYLEQGWTLSDAVYMVVITVFSVGYEEVEPVTTLSLRVITMLIIIAGDASKVYFVGSLVRFITEGEIGKAMEEHRKSREIGNIKDHAIICGYGRLGQTLARELAAKKFPCVIVDSNAERVTLAHDHGHLALIGDAGNEETLNEVRIDKCVVLATVLPSDTVNVFITLTARNMRPDLRIMARAEDPSSEKKLRQAGANEVTLPAFIGGIQMANSITHASLDTILRDSTDHLNNDLKGLGVSISQHLVVSNGVDDGKTLVQFLKGNEESCMILALKKGDGTLIQHPGGKTRLDGNDVIMLISRDNKAR